MATKFATIKGVNTLIEPMGFDRGGVALVSFDLAGTVYTGGTDTVQLGGGGSDGANSTSSTLAVIMGTNHRRDGRTVTIQSVAGVSVFPGNQAAATNGPLIFAQSVATSGGNVTLNLFSAITAGSAITTTTGAWERACGIVVVYTISLLSSD